MAGIAGIARADARDDVDRMLDRMAYRGPAGRAVICVDGVTLGAAWPWAQAGVPDLLSTARTAQDAAGRARGPVQS
jgi:hypothetical protein